MSLEIRSKSSLVRLLTAHCNKCNQSSSKKDAHFLQPYSTLEWFLVFFRMNVNYLPMLLTAFLFSTHQSPGIYLVIINLLPMCGRIRILSREYQTERNIYGLLSISDSKEGPSTHGIETKFNRQ